MSSCQLRVARFRVIEAFPATYSFEQILSQEQSSLFLLKGHENDTEDVISIKIIALQFRRLTLTFRFQTDVVVTSRAAFPTS